MKYIHTLLIVSLSVISCSGAFAGVTTQPVRMGLNDSLETALANASDILTAEEDLAVSQARVRQAGALALPSFRIDASYRRLDELQEVELGDEVTETGSLDNYNVDFRLEQLLWASGKVNAALNAARANEEYTLWQRKQVDQQIARNIRRSFFDLLLAEEVIAVHSNGVDLFSALLGEAEKKFNQGAVAEFDLVSAKVKLANERPALIRSENTFEVGTREFARLLNNGDESVAPAGDLLPVVLTNRLEELETFAMKQRPMLQMMRSLVELRREDVSASRADYLPSITAYANYNGANAYQYAGYDDFNWHWSAGLVASWNVWNGGLSYSVVSEKRHLEQKARILLDDAEKEVRLQVNKAWLDYRAAREAMSAAEVTVGQAVHALEIANAGYSSGVSTYLETSDAALSLKQSRLTYLRSVRDLNIAAVELMHAAGIPAREMVRFGKLKRKIDE